MAKDKLVAAEGYCHAGLAAECALTALIMRKERLNAWPSKEFRPDLHTHNLRTLAQIAAVVISRSDPLASSWHVVLQWDRNQGYEPKPMPRRVADSMIKAAFSEKGVVTWIRSILT